MRHHFLAGNAEPHARFTTLLVGQQRTDGVAHEGTRFRMVKGAAVFDYFDATPPPGEADVNLRVIQRHALPLQAGSFYCRLRRDETLSRRRRTFDPSADV